ncbi:unnamed protein product [Prorocentrum cordatum]|uniref:BZIP domain-containing protein n=1 Tax=Prorocentrum cordatum TaxID=2364126 RepID=A0ABN9W373_9DINO|nr:unnamed protein product [Polarella glacialis]
MRRPAARDTGTRLSSIWSSGKETPGDTCWQPNLQETSESNRNRQRQTEKPGARMAHRQQNVDWGLTSPRTHQSNVRRASERRAANRRRELKTQIRQDNVYLKQNRIGSIGSKKDSSFSTSAVGNSGLACRGGGGPSDAPAPRERTARSSAPPRGAGGQDPNRDAAAWERGRGWRGTRRSEDAVNLFSKDAHLLNGMLTLAWFWAWVPEHPRSNLRVAQKRSNMSEWGPSWLRASPTRAQTRSNEAPERVLFFFSCGAPHTWPPNGN